MDQICEIAQSPIGTGQFSVSVPRNLHIQCLMWPICIVVVDEVVKAHLLLEVLGGGSCGLVLQGQAHALVPTVLVRDDWA